MAETGGPLTLELLAWISERPRTYAETMAAWRTTCPRHSVWEDALTDGLVKVMHGGNTNNECSVVLSAQGRAALQRKTVKVVEQ